MKRSCAAFTLAELLIGIAITSLLGLSVATVSSALSGRYCRAENRYRNMQSVRFAAMSVQAQVRKAHLITELSDRQMMLWQENDDGDGRINPSELVLITYDQPAGRLIQYQIVLPDWLPPGWRKFLDPPVDLRSVVENPEFWALVVRASSFCQDRALAEEITAFRLAAATPAPLTKLAVVHLTAGQGPEALHLRGSAAPRADRTSQVSLVLGHYVLSTE